MGKADNGKMKYPPGFLCRYLAVKAPPPLPERLGMLPKARAVSNEITREAYRRNAT